MTPELQKVLAAISERLSRRKWEDTDVYPIPYGDLKVLIQAAVSGKDERCLCEACGAKTDPFNLSDHLFGVEARGDVRAEFAKRAAGRLVL